MDAIRLDKSRVAIGPRHKILAETGLPISHKWNSARDCFQIVLSCNIAAYEYRKIVCKPEWRANHETEFFEVFGFCLIINGLRVADGRMFQDGSVGGSGVLGIDVDLL